MFGIGMTELLVILVLATIVLGPEKMIEFAGQLGRWIAKFRAETNEVTREFREAFDMELGEFKQDLNEVKHELAELKDVGDSLASQLDPSTPPRRRPNYNLPTQSRLPGRPAYNLPTGMQAARSAPAPVATAAPALTTATAAATMVAIQPSPPEEIPSREIVRDLSPDAEGVEIGFGVLMGEDEQAEAFVLEEPVLMEEPADGQSGDAAIGEALKEEQECV